MRRFGLLLMLVASLPLSAETFVAAERIDRGESNLANTPPGEGWVEVQFMVDTDGMPFALSVVASFGDPSYRAAALRAVRDWRYRGATVDGEARESAARGKVTFRAPGIDTGASRRSVKTFGRAVRAVEQGQRDKARRDATALVSKARNLYEGALANMAMSLFEGKWGTERAQLEYLTAAVAYETRALFLPDDLFRRALRNKFSLEVRLKRFGEALQTFEVLAALEDDVRPSILETIERLDELARDDRAYRVEADLGAESRSWNIVLFKDEFAVIDLDGAVTDVALRCERKFLKLAVVADQVYQIPKAYGRCRAEFVGAAGTTFTLVQT